MEHIAKAMELKAGLDKLRPIGKEQEEIIMQKFRLDWDYHSNHLEGNSLTYGETKALILFGITAQGKPLKDHFEITGHDEAIKWVTEIVKDGYPLTEQFIRELHVLLLKEPFERPAETLDGQKTTKRIEVGKYKTTPNHVRTKTGEIFRFATPEETPALMHDLIEWYRQKKKSPDVNPIILAAEFHYRFIRIHPFDDGNGRIARILMNFILMQFGYPPVIIKTEDKGNYYSVLQLADAGNIEPFIDYIAQNLTRSLEIMIAGAKGENIEEPDDLDKEIALLEQKLKSNKSNTPVTKSQSVVLEVFKHSIKHLIQYFILSCQKFDRFYVNNHISILFDGAVIHRLDTNRLDKREVIVAIEEKLKVNQNGFALQYVHKELKLEGKEDVSNIPTLIVNFFETKYRIRYDDNSIEALYNEQLDTMKFEEFVKRSAQKHKKFIEARLKDANQ